MESIPELDTEIELDKEIYPASSASTLTARLMIRNSTADPVTLTFPTGQVYDLEIHDDEGNVVYGWSRDKTFTQMVTTLQIQYEKDYAITAPLAHLKPGRYVAQAWLAVEGPPRAYSGSARFEIK
jgi:hypothetical protein